MLGVWLLLAISDYGWQFNNQPSDTIPGVGGVVASVVGGAVRTQDGVDVTGDPSFIDLGTLTLGGSHTFEMLFKRAVSETTQRVFHCTDEAGDNWVDVNFIGAGGLEGNWNFGFRGAGSVDVTFKPEIEHMWTHVVFTVLESSEVVMYVNDTAISGIVVGTGALPTVALTNCHLGDTFQGEIRAFNVYDRTLTQEEINTAYERAIPFNATKLFSWDLRVPSYLDWGSNKFDGAPGWSCTNPSSVNEGMVLNWDNPESHTTLLDSICAPWSNSPNFGTPGHRAGCSPYPHPPDFTGNIDHAGGQSEGGVGGGSTQCVMRCPNGDVDCPPYGASHCVRPNTRPLPGVPGKWDHAICMYPHVEGVSGPAGHQPAATGVGTFYSTSTYAGMPHSGFTGPYPVMQTRKPATVVTDVGVSAIPATPNWWIWSNLGNMAEYPITGSKSFEMQVYVNNFYVDDDTDTTSGLLACTSTNKKWFQLWFDSDGYLTWGIVNHDSQRGPLLPKVNKSHIVVTVAANGTTVIYLDKIPTSLPSHNSLPNIQYDNCYLGGGIDVTISSFHIYDGVMTAAEVHTAFHHCAEEAPAPAAGTKPAEESGDSSAATVVAIVVTVLMDAAIAAVVVASTVVVSIAVREITHAKRN